MFTDKDKTSIQISTSVRNLLKEFCDERGFKMNRFVEMAILQSITGSYSIINHEDDKTTS